MKRYGIFAAVILASSLAALQGCGSDTGETGGAGGSTTTTTTTTTTTSGTTTTTTTTTTTAAPPPPVLGAQIDRFGRPAINTALNHTFDANATTANAAKDTYNADGDPTKWIAAYGAEFAANLAILDSLDTNCGNQLLAKPAAGGVIPADRYAGLAGALAGDELYIKTDAAMCGIYLAVEANATGVVVNGDCGGRKLDYDVIDISYSVLAAGALQGVSDGVPADADTAGTTFPYLAAPH